MPRIIYNCLHTRDGNSPIENWLTKLLYAHMMECYAAIERGVTDIRRDL